MIIFCLAGQLVHTILSLIVDPLHHGAHLPQLPQHWYKVTSLLVKHLQAAIDNAAMLDVIAIVPVQLSEDP